MEPDLRQWRTIADGNRPGSLPQHLTNRAQKRQAASFCSEIAKDPAGEMGATATESATDCGFCNWIRCLRKDSFPDVLQSAQFCRSEPEQNAIRTESYWPSARIRLSGWLRVCPDCVLFRPGPAKLSRLQYNQSMKEDLGVGFRFPSFTVQPPCTLLSSVAGWGAQTAPALGRIQYVCYFIRPCATLLEYRLLGMPRVRGALRDSC